MKRSRSFASNQFGIAVAIPDEGDCTRLVTSVRMTFAPVDRGRDFVIGSNQEDRFQFRVERNLALVNVPIYDMPIECRGGCDVVIRERSDPRSCIQVAVFAGVIDYEDVPADTSLPADPDAHYCVRMASVGDRLTVVVVSDPGRAAYLTSKHGTRTTLNGVLDACLKDSANDHPHRPFTATLHTMSEPILPERTIP